MDEILTVSQVLNKADPKKVISLYNDIYREEYEVGTYGKFLRLVNAAVGVKSTCTCVVDKQVKELDGEVSYDVYGMEGNDKPYYALDFTDWGEWKTMPVEDATNLNLTPDELACHIFYEMTWHGFPQDMEARRDEMLDAFEECKRKYSETFEE